MTPDWLKVPNLITYVRLATIPAFVLLHVRGEAWIALWCFVGAMASDVVDGFLARLLQQRTRLGALLDPIADKALVLTALILLVLGGRLPAWLLGVHLLRDALMLGGAAAVALKRREIPATPSRIGKYATFTVTLTISLALWALSGATPLLLAYTAVGGYVAGLCVVVSTAQYWLRYGNLLLAPGRTQRGP